MHSIHVYVLFFSMIFHISFNFLSCMLSDEPDEPMNAFVYGLNQFQEHTLAQDVLLKQDMDCLWAEHWDLTWKESYRKTNLTLLCSLKYEYVLLCWSHATILLWLCGYGIGWCNDSELYVFIINFIFVIQLFYLLNSCWRNTPFVCTSALYRKAFTFLFLAWKFDFQLKMQIL